MPTLDLRVQHSSLQYSDTPAQQDHDVKKLFHEGKAYPIKTGTEAGGGNGNFDALKKYAREYNHILHLARDNWIAVDRRIVRNGSVRRGEVFVADNDRISGPQQDSVFATLSFTHADARIGRIHQAAAHYPTKGDRPGTPNYRFTQLYAKKLDEWMTKVAKGEALAFVNGDFNMPDRELDWAHGGHFTSMADELKAWKNTGHGPIDGFASYDLDGRVQAKRFTVLDDTEMKMFFDHYVCRGVWTIRQLKIK